MKMPRPLMLFLLATSLAFLCSAFMVGVALDEKVYGVYDESWILTYYMKGDAVYDMQWFLQYYVRNDTLYDRNWQRRYFIKGDEIYDEYRHLQYRIKEYTADE